MFRNRWIRIPLLFAVWYIAWQLIIRLLSPYPIHLWGIIISGLLLGFWIEGSAWLRVRSKYGKVDPTVLDPHQKRSFMLMQDKDHALETCKTAVESLPKLKLRRVDADLCRITLKSKKHWVSRSSRFTIDLHEVADHLTEVIVETKPLPMVLVDSSGPWKTIDQIVSEIKKLDSQPSKEALNDGVEMLQDLTMRPIKVRR